MLVNEVKITLKGKYDLTKLKELRYYRARNHWRFYGQMHLYIFRPMIDGIEIIIQPKNNDIKLPHIITFGQINDWVKLSVGAIDKAPKGTRANP